MMLTISGMSGFAVQFQSVLPKEGQVEWHPSLRVLQNSAVTMICPKHWEPMLVQCTMTINLVIGATEDVATEGRWVP